MFRPPDGDAQLCHGYTVSQVRALSLSLVTKQTWYQSVDFDLRLEGARHAAIEHIYASDLPPEPSGVLRAAATAVGQDVQQLHRFYGRNTHDRYASTVAGVYRNWWSAASPCHGPESAVIDRMALAQIWPRLRPEHREALAALTVYTTTGWRPRRWASPAPGSRLGSAQHGARSSPSGMKASRHLGYERKTSGEDQARALLDQIQDRSCAPPEVPSEGLPPDAAGTCLTEPAVNAEALRADRVPRQRVCGPRTIRLAPRGGEAGMKLADCPPPPLPGPSRTPGTNATMTTPVTTAISATPAGIRAPQPAARDCRQVTEADIALSGAAGPGRSGELRAQCPSRGLAAAREAD